jgi:hypothetical protein
MSHNVSNHCSCCRHLPLKPRLRACPDRPRLLLWRARRRNDLCSPDESDGKRPDRHPWRTLHPVPRQRPRPVRARADHRPLGQRRAGAGHDACGRGCRVRLLGHVLINPRCPLIPQQRRRSGHPTRSAKGQQRTLSAGYATPCSPLLWLGRKGRASLRPLQTSFRGMPEIYQDNSRAFFVASGVPRCTTRLRCSCSLRRWRSDRPIKRPISSRRFQTCARSAHVSGQCLACFFEKQMRTICMG